MRRNEAGQRLASSAGVRPAGVPVKELHLEGGIDLQVEGIAINADAGNLDGSLDMLRKELDHFAGIGFEYVEIAPHGAGVIHGGSLHREQMKKLLRVFSDYPFNYVTHSPNPMNLMNREHLELEKRMFLSSLQFAGETGSRVMVYHAGRWLPEERFQLPGVQVPTPEQQKSMCDLERGLLREMGALAEQYGVTIAVENARPYLDASLYCYGEYLQLLADMIAQVNHPRVGITLDLGHAWLASCHYGYNLLDGVDAVRPYIRHIHLHDNYGRCCASYEKKQGELLATGRGDLHLPIGWGDVPAREVFAILQDYRGVVTLEIRPRYRSFYGEALTNARALLAQGTAMV